MIFYFYFLNFLTSIIAVLLCGLQSVRIFYNIESSFVRLGPVMHAYSCLCLSLQWDWNEIGFNLMLHGEQNQLMMEVPKLFPLKEKIVNMNTVNSIDNKNSDMEKAACIYRFIHTNDKILPERTHIFHFDEICMENFKQTMCAWLQQSHQRY